MSALALSAAALTASGRVQLLPQEVELRLLDRVDVEFPSDAPGGATGKQAARLLVRPRAAQQRARGAARARVHASDAAPRRMAYCA